MKRARVPRGSAISSAGKLTSPARIVLYSFLAAFSVLIVTTMLQWLVYDDWLHRSGPLRLIGATAAALITFSFVLHWQNGVRRRHGEMLRRFETIAEMNDRVRNELQAIECLTYAADHSVTKAVKSAVDGIEEALAGVVAQNRESTAANKKPIARATKPLGRGAIQG